jgi:DNA-directed RNA polymerase subunit RPC12/RpoP
MEEKGMENKICCGECGKDLMRYVGWGYIRGYVFSEYRCVGCGGRVIVEGRYEKDDERAIEFGGGKARVGNLE